MNDKIPAEVAASNPAKKEESPTKNIFTEISIQWLLYPILIVYFFPVLTIGWAAVVTKGFSETGVSITFAQVMASEFYESLRLTIGVIFLPLLTAYAVKIDSTKSKIPISTASLILVLLIFFIITIAVYGIVEISQESLSRLDKTIDGKNFSLRTFFKNSTAIYAKELLANIAVVLGVTLKK